MGRFPAAPTVFYHHTTMQRAHELLLYGFPSGDDGIEVWISSDPKPVEGQAVIRIAMPPDIGSRTWRWARLQASPGGEGFSVPASLLTTASLTVLEPAPTTVNLAPPSGTVE